ncbi:MAG: HPF/RaiA family ribosome-associated protein, partial [Planctomycetes bacterium]|nr:HPF/RaiA family ribosome-associated protein [Planctomycetota bacterium]
HDARVIVNGEGGESQVELVVSGAKGVSFSARAMAPNVHQAVLHAEHKVEAQVRRHKAKLHPRRPRQPIVQES